MAGLRNRFGVLEKLITRTQSVVYYDLDTFSQSGFDGIHRLPFSIKILLENAIRSEDGDTITESQVARLARWRPGSQELFEIPFMPARILLQDFTGVPAVADIAAMRDAAGRLYGDPMRVRLNVPAELVIDHSVQVDEYGTPQARELNVKKEFERNAERYTFLRWGHNSFKNLKVIPPDTGIVHQVNLEYLARVVFTKSIGGEILAFPDTLVGLDSHTTMINGAGVLGWGVGGIEAEAVMLGRPYYFMSPEVIGFNLIGELPSSATSTDLVLAITQLLREKGVVGKFVEFFGPGLDHLPLEDRTTIANMAPEYGATVGFFPVDEKTLTYLRVTGRPENHIELIERYLKAQGLFRDRNTPDPDYTDIVNFDMGDVVPCLAGPRRPQERIPLDRLPSVFEQETRHACEIGQGDPADLVAQEHHWEDEGGHIAESADTALENCTVSNSSRGVRVRLINGREFKLFHGSVIIAAITSCTNTSNPAVMIQAGLLAKKAVEKGLRTKSWVKTSMAPGSRVVTDYLKASGLMPYLETLGFHTVAYGCTTCIGNSGAISEPIARAVQENHLMAASVLSGNRNFAGRISPLTQLNYLASPPLVVAYALAGNVAYDLKNEHLGHDPEGNPVYLSDIWPSVKEVKEAAAGFITPEMYEKVYADVFDGSELWHELKTPKGAVFQWDENSTYIKPPPFFQSVTLTVPPLTDIKGARVLVLLGNTVTTDHISPAGAIPPDSPAGKYLRNQGVSISEFNSYGSRRGNHEVMMRGTFGNIRLENRLVPERTGGWTRYLPTNEEMSIYQAAMAYKKEGTPLLIIAGEDYGTGSSRDWAAKGTALLGVRAVIAESFERIHRSNLVCMGVLPLQFKPGENQEALGLDGTEIYDITGIENGIEPGADLLVRAAVPGGTSIEFTVTARIDVPVEMTYYRHGGILPFILRGLESVNRSRTNGDR
ncbi:MAG: aconitate hydratase AcnA [Desulfobacterales bacterium]